MCVLCLWELYYCVSLATRRIECVKCVEGVGVGVGVLPVAMWVQVCYWNENDSMYIRLVAGGRLLGAEQQAMRPG